MASPIASLSALDLRGLGEDGREYLPNIEEVVVFSLPMNIKFRGITRREGLLMRGKEGWGECSPFWDYGPAESSRWLRSGLESANTPAPPTLRDAIPVNVTIPVCSEQEAVRRLHLQLGAATAKVKVAGPGTNPAADVRRVKAVAETLFALHGSAARVRVDANTAWTVPQAAAALEELDEAAGILGGLEYAEQPVATTSELAQLRKSTRVPLAADESIRRSESPLEVRDRGAADVAVLKVAPLGGVSKALTLGVELGLPTVVSSALDSSIGLAAGVSLAASLPVLDYACGLNTGTLLAADVVDQPLLARAGVQSVEEAEAVREGGLTSRNEPVDPGVQERWLKRLALMLAELREAQES